MSTFRFPRPLFGSLLVIGSCAALADNAWAGVADVDWPSTPLVAHKDFQAVDANGLGTFGGSFPLRLQGIILNNPEDMLSMTPYTPNPVLFSLGASYQVYIQPIEPADYGGTAVFMGQHYGNVPPNIDFSTMPPTPNPSRSYTDSEWNAEMDRVTHDRTTGHLFRAGDLVEIHAQESLFYGGKLNVNEAHIKEDIADFELQLLTADYGLPTPHSIQLADIWTGTPAGGHVRFDSDREAGGEHYQGSLVELRNVKLVTPASGWNANATVQVSDIDGRTFAVKLGLNTGFVPAHAPTGFFRAVGIFDQEDTNNAVYDAGYRLWIMDPSTVAASLPGDYDASGTVNNDDYVAWRTNFGSTSQLAADGNGDGEVNAADYVVWRAHLGTSLASSGMSSAAVPEPSSLVIAFTGIFGGAFCSALWRGERRLRR